MQLLKTDIVRELQCMGTKKIAARYSFELYKNKRNPIHVEC